MNNLSIEVGNILKGVSITDTKFQGATSLNQIEAYGLIRPTSAASATKSSDPKLLDARRLHEEHQRAWLKARVLRAAAYSRYIEAVEVNKTIPGGTPAITLYTQTNLDMKLEGLVIPYSSMFIAIDGETQTEGRYLLRDRIAATGDNPIAVTVYHNMGTDEARQILHDYNVKAFPISEKEAAAFNNAGVLTSAISKATNIAQLSIRDINRKGSLSIKNTVVAYAQLLFCAAGYNLQAEGIARNVTPKILGILNEGLATPLPPMFEEQLASILNAAKVNPLIGKSPTQVWQVAGVKLSQGVNASSLNWMAANKAFADTKAGGRGGLRISPATRLSTIANAI